MVACPEHVLLYLQAAANPKTCAPVAEAAGAACAAGEQGNQKGFVA